MKLQHNFFEKTVEKFPKNIAVDDHGEKITYQKLNNEANKLANFLRKLGVKPNNRICILLDKNINQYLSILGILKAGACWVPLSKNFPSERLRNMIKNIDPFLIITDEISLKKNNNIFKKLNILVIDKLKINKKKKFSRNDFYKEETTKPKDINVSTDLAYIIFTSGSTGLPKGVMVSHQNTSEYLKNKAMYFKPKPRLRFAHISEITFDPSIFDIFVCWSNGGTVVPFNKNSYKISPINFFINNKNINIIFTLPSFVGSILDSKNHNQLKYLKKLKFIVLTGEQVLNDLVRKIYKMIKGVKVFNAYGTTETAIISNWNLLDKKIKKDQPISIGNVLPNIRYLLVDDQGRQTLNKGEICFSGEQISTGYWDNEYLNKKFFIRLSVDGKFFATFYRTGDIVKIMNKELYLEGRADNQVKIKGYRIELEEIKNNLKSLEEIEDTFILAHSENQAKKLFFFIKFQSNKNTQIAKKTLNQYIKNNFPFYMMPSNIFYLKKNLPRNINGKIDKKKLIMDYIDNG